ncbi:MAG: SDR family oxidoreductase [Tagaea sp.]|nr:SDR family oxidoreductase [Tagaea sp.]
MPAPRVERPHRNVTDIYSLKGRVALITGASRGLGLVMARALAEAGAHVALNDLDPAPLAEAIEKLRGEGLSVEGLPFDVTDHAAARAAIADLERRRKIDVLVNNAGIVVRKRLWEATDADWERVIATNLTSLHVISKAVAEGMVARGSGRIVNIASIMGLIGRAGVVSYIAAKHGVVGLTKALAAELGPRGINVNAIAPGYILTEINRSVIDDQFFHSLVVDRTPLKRWGDPADLAGPVVFLASDAAAFVNAHTLVIDGGISTTILQPEHVA